MRHLRSLLALAARGVQLNRAGASPVLPRLDNSLGSLPCWTASALPGDHIVSFRFSAGLSSRSDDDEGADLTSDSHRSRRWSSGGRKSQSSWEAEQLARPSSGEGGSERRGARRRPGASHRDDLSARMDADDEALRQELSRSGPESEIEATLDASSDGQTNNAEAAEIPEAEAADVEAAEAVGSSDYEQAAEALDLPDDAEAEEVAAAENEADATLAASPDERSSGSSSSDTDSDSDEEANGDDGASHSPSSSIGRRAMDELEGGASDLAEIMAASKKKQRFMLQQKLMSKDSQEGLASDLRPPDTGDFRMKIVDVNRTSKGGRAGRIMGCSALVVVGNNDGILGHGTGKATEAKAAVDKATRRAIKTLSYVPRFREHTIYYSTTVLFGKTKLIMYPLSSCRGLRCSDLMTSICQLAGIKDIGIKIQGSRNLRNSVMALFKAFDQMQDRVDETSVDATPSPDWPNDKWKARQRMKLDRLYGELDALNARQKEDDADTAGMLELLKRVPPIESVEVS